ncbi:hypothetical protein FACS189474_0410 [Bacteroidia bacterium]|nr:hypothetical protein FACS189474_0410 [Bacteroidia bacterium]
MEVVVHGTKGGYKSNFRPNITPTFSLSDIRNGSNNENPLGKSVYSIAFTNGGCVFTKYTIVRDTLRSFATGNIAFSLFISADKELSGKGANVKSLLDKLMTHYIANYVKDNNINRGETTIIQEDWSFLKTVLNEYREQSNTNDETIATGTQEEPAFVYYTTDEEFQKYFDAPYHQDEYGAYKQIFFVESSLKNKPENPLNALRHSENDLTGKIDFDNPSYTLLINGNGFNVQPRNKIRKKQTLTITYYKRDFYKTPNAITGTWNIIKRSYPNCIEVDDVRKTVTIKQIELCPECKTITIMVKDNRGKLRHDAEIIFESNKSRYEVEKNNTNNEFTFKGDDIGLTWEISARIEKENMFSDTISITPQKQNEVLKLILKKRKIVNIEAVDENGQKINPFEYWINDGEGYRRGGQHVFEGDDIEKHWNIEARVEGYSSDTVEYCPATGKNPLIITLKKRQKSDIYKFSFTEGKNGKIEGNNQSLYTDHYIPVCLKELINDNQDCKVKKLHSNSCNFEITAKPNFGYKFDKWEKQKKNDEYTITAQFKSMIIEGVIASLILIAIVVLTATFWDDIFSGQSQKSQQQTITSTQITAYVEGDSLMLPTLKFYQNYWEKQKQSSSTNLKEWQSVDNEIKQAITKRTTIDEKKFLELKYDDFKRSRTQQTFIKTVSNIGDSTKAKLVADKLGDVSALTLTQIADSIESILAKIELSSEFPLKKGSKGENVKKLQEALNKIYRLTLTVDGDFGGSCVTALKNNGLPEEISENYFNDLIQQSQQITTDTGRSNSRSSATGHSSESATTPPNDDKTSEIIQYIKGSELKKATLEEYKNQTTNQNLKKSIDLALKFWVIDGTKNKSYSSYQKELDNDNNLNHSELKIVVDVQCRKEKPRYVVELPRSDQNKKLNELKDKLQ